MIAVSDTWLANRLTEFKASLTFSTRLPLGRAAPVGPVNLAMAAWAFPLVGLVIGFIGAAVYGVLHRVGVLAWPAATLSVVATLLATGCLHEDGLADTADGFGGGATKEDKLAIMRDSRIGTYGVCALILVVLLRVSVLASFFSTLSVGWALLASHAGARATMMAFMFLTPPARHDGLSADAGRPPRESLIAAVALGLLIIALCLGPSRMIAALICLLVVLGMMLRFSRKQIGGQTGDVLGAVEQVSEIVILLVALR
jgi:adenosylcobinamide-GDP ribazoletransferase